MPITHAGFIRAASDYSLKKQAEIRRTTTRTPKSYLQSKRQPFWVNVDAEIARCGTEALVYLKRRKTIALYLPGTTKEEEPFEAYSKCIN